MRGPLQTNFPPLQRRYGMKNIFYFTLAFIIALWAFAYGLREYTLWATNGRCEAMFNCVCPSLGNGICDGLHQIYGRKNG